MLIEVVSVTNYSCLWDLASFTWTYRCIADSFRQHQEDKMVVEDLQNIYSEAKVKFASRKALLLSKLAYQIYYNFVPSKTIWKQHTFFK